MTNWSKKRKIMRLYDLTAHMYDMRYFEEQKLKIEAALEEMQIKENCAILDVGCGTGILFKYVAGKAKLVVGVDISKKMLLYAKRRAENFESVHLVLADADNMPFRENVFDSVFSVTLLQNMPNSNKTLKEIGRVAKGFATIVATGMKKAFTAQRFKAMLLNAGLKSIAFKDRGLKCYVVVCVKS